GPGPGRCPRRPHPGSPAWRPRRSPPHEPPWARPLSRFLFHAVTPSPQGCRTSHASTSPLKRPLSSWVRDLPHTVIMAALTAPAPPRSGAVTPVEPATAAAPNRSRHPRLDQQLKQQPQAVHLDQDRRRAGAARGLPDNRTGAWAAEGLAPGPASVIAIVTPTRRWVSARSSSTTRA